jgi:hypothetical protein
MMELNHFGAGTLKDKLAHAKSGTPALMELNHLGVGTIADKLAH